MKKFLGVACAAGMVMGMMVPMCAFADDTISITVEAYDYTAVDASVSGASANGVIMEYKVEVSAGTTDKEAVTKAFEAEGISITGVDDGYVTEINGLTGAYPGGWCISYNGDDYSNWGLGYLGAAGDGVVSDGDVIRFDYTVDGGTDIAMAYYGQPILTSITVDGATQDFSKETVYDTATYAGVTTYYEGKADAADKKVMTGSGTEADPFVISADLSDSAGSVVDVSYTTCLDKNYGTVDLPSSVDLKNDVTFTVTANDGLKSYYRLTSNGSAVSGDTTSFIPFIIIGVVAVAAIVFLLLTSKNKKKK